MLSDIYQWILDNYPYFRKRGPGWRNSIRHNLSLNDCFIKAGRSANGKGHYWAVHTANVDDFEKGDFRRRRAQKKVRRAMGFSVPDEDDDSPAASPILSKNINANAVEADAFEKKKVLKSSIDKKLWSGCRVVLENVEEKQGGDVEYVPEGVDQQTEMVMESIEEIVKGGEKEWNREKKQKSRKRSFDMENILKPDKKNIIYQANNPVKYFKSTLNEVEFLNGNPQKTNHEKVNFSRIKYHLTFPQHAMNERSELSFASFHAEDQTDKTLTVCGRVSNDEERTQTDANQNLLTTDANQCNNQNSTTSISSFELFRASIENHWKERLKEGDAKKHKRRNHSKAD